MLLLQHIHASGAKFLTFELVFVATESLCKYSYASLPKLDFHIYARIRKPK